MKVLLIGSGAREHALAWKLLQSPKLSHLYMTATHAGVEALQGQFSVTITRVASQAPHHTDLVEFALTHAIDWVLIGNEAPLAAGLSDQLRVAGIQVFGPAQAAAQIESSKAFAKDFMQRYNIPTARYGVFTDLATAQAHLDDYESHLVIKASGLAAGKGVFVVENRTEAKVILQQLLQERSLGEAGATVVLEERLYGAELSLLCFTDGYSLALMPAVRDYKRLFNGDRGPNTGGMGAYTPVTLPKGVTLTQLSQTILQPTIDGLRQEGRLFIGVLYAGLMLTEEGPRVLEFNCRFGDPETQVLMPLLQTDLLAIMQACVEGSLSHCSIRWHKESAVAVVLAAKQYPEVSQTGDIITGCDTQEPAGFIFHAGTRDYNGQVLTAGGRVLTITAVAEVVEQAAQQVYRHIRQIQFTGMQYRSDIGSSGHVLDHYAKAGVDIEAGHRAVALMTPAVQATYGPEVLAGIGAFGGLFSATLLQAMQTPVLVASTDGVGTKVELAIAAKRLLGLGYDIVHHCVNDILVQGARPLFFLDYIASSRLNPAQVAAVVSSMATACQAVGCALLGGETAEMPGIYAPDKMDIVGTLIGIVEQVDILPQPTLQAGDVLLGMASSGPHTNGYSLLRQIIAGRSLEEIIPELGISLAEALLTPHRCYWPVLCRALQHSQRPIKALVHITGGGFWDNIPRVLPGHLQAQLHRGSWPIPALFQWIQHQAHIPFEQMCRVFNMGVGMIIIADPQHTALLHSLMDEPLWTLGQLVPGQRIVSLY